MRSSGLQRQMQLTMILAVALTLHVVESLFPPLPVPGAKIGLANIASLVALRYLGFGAAIGISAARSILGSMLGGKFWGLGFWMSLSGATLSATAMGIALRVLPKGCSSVWASVIGSIVHASCQLAIAIIALQQPGLLIGAPVLMGLSIVTGVFIGIACDSLDGAVRQYVRSRNRR
ncbi:MAG: Gx transporter family protein [Clostridia bacterium]|nr:Gx transporter family protein [Clostridia bacterium]